MVFSIAAWIGNDRDANEKRDNSCLLWLVSEKVFRSKKYYRRLALVSHATFGIVVDYLANGGSDE